MNTKEFIHALAERLHVSNKEAAMLLKNTTSAIRDIVTEEKKLTIARLGSFRLKKSASRTAYIPALGKKILLPPKSSVHFHPADSLKDKLKNITRP